ncbi:hypothetical protein JCM10207_009046 [Rhodosporidiobolus poonsookiae]
METLTPHPHRILSTTPELSRATPSQVPRSLPSAERVKDDFAPAKHLLRSSSPMFSLAAEYDPALAQDDGALSRTITSKATFAPGGTTRTQSPSPLLWSESGWNAGHFTFSPFGPAEHAHEHEQQGGDERRSSVGSSLSSLSDPNSSPGDKDLSRSTAASSLSSSPVLRSKLAPTAQSFVPKLTRLTPAGPPSRSPLTSLESVASLFSYGPSLGNTGGSSSASNSPIEPLSPPPFPLHPSEARLDYDGHLVSQGAKYMIADEILQLQSLGPAHDDELETLSMFEAGPSGRSRTVSEGSNFARGIEQWRMQHSPAAPATFPLRQGAFPPGPSSASGAFERSRSSSIASTASSYFAPRPSLERANTAAQLQSYFGPSPVEVNAPLPAGFDSFDASYPTSHHLSRTSSFSSLAGVAPYPPLAHPEPFNLTPDDPLYMQAREVFLESSFSSLSGAPTAQHRQAMFKHFDAAMCTLNPLATLYGLSQEAANQLLAEPAQSGVSDIVLKVAAMRGRQQQMASVQRSAMGAILPGPSPNNRKLNLYKTELCRSWEEKGSCRYGVKCQFAHGIHELREVARHPKFKSEVCRTFYQQGSCPYGRRCCFIHATGEAAFESGSTSPAKGSAPGSRAESPVETTVSRLNARMTSTAVTSAPSRTFGPALSELISSGNGNGSSSSSSVQSSPRQTMRPELAPAPAPFPDTGALFGLGISQRPGQAPPTFREGPRSRLHRLTSLSGSSTPSTVMSPALPPIDTFQPHARHDSNASLSTSSSAASGPHSSPLLARHGSTSSLSSMGSPTMLRPLGGEWLCSTNVGASSSALDWPQESAMEHLSLDDFPAASDVQH